MRYLVVLLLVVASAETNAGEYRVKTDLSNVANLNQLTSGIEHYSRTPWMFSEAQQAKLAENAFVVIPGDAEQFFQVYESDHYGMAPRIPNFITTDCALHMYHVLFDFTLKAVEVEHLLPVLRELTGGMLTASLEQASMYEDSTVRVAAARNALLFAVAARLLNLEEPDLPQELRDQVNAELAKIDAHAGRFECAVTGAGLDYTQFVVRGHYTRAKATEAYFKAMMWYGLVSFPLDSLSLQDDATLLQPVLLCDALYAEHANGVPMSALWNKVYAITTLYVGESLHLTPQQLSRTIPQKSRDNYFRPPSYVKHKSDRHFSFALDSWRWSLNKLPPPRVEAQAVGLTTGVQMRFLGQRYLPDSYVLQMLSDYNSRPWPKGLDVMAVLGSARAEEHLTSLYNECANWSEYGPRLQALQSEFQAYDNEWNESLLTGWLNLLQALHETRADYPSFMQNIAWQDKQLTTTLASWAEMRRDAILYANPSYAEGDMGGDTFDVRGYVEPAQEFWKRLQEQVAAQRRVLMAAGFYSDDMADIFERYADLVEFCKAATEKELQGIVLSDQEYNRIRWFGAEVERWTLDVLNLDRHIPVFDRRDGWEPTHIDSALTTQDVWLKSWYQVTGPDRDLACVADVHNSGDLCLEVAAGHLDNIYVVVPIGDHLRITRGAVFSYYEFTYPADHRLNDEAWQEMLKRSAAPPRPEWINSYVVP